jgi:hypothetical protein
MNDVRNASAILMNRNVPLFAQLMTAAFPIQKSLRQQMSFWIKPSNSILTKKLTQKKCGVVSGINSPFPAHLIK